MTALIKYPWLNENPQTLIQTPVETNVQASGKSVQKTIQKSTREDRLKFGLEFIEKVLDPGEKSFSQELIGFFQKQKRLMQNNVDNFFKDYSGSLSINGQQFLFDIEDQNEKFIKIYSPEIEETLERVKRKTERELRATIEFAVDDNMIRNFINERLEYIKGINTNTFKLAGNEIGAAIDEAIKNQSTIKQVEKEIKVAINSAMSKRLNNEFTKFSYKTIARTEINSIANTARYQMFRKAGVEKHEWIDSDGDSVRETHREVDGAVVELGEMFPVVNMRYPMDPIGAAKEVINCRCTTRAVSGD